MNKLWMLCAIIYAMMISFGCNDDNEVRISQGAALNEKHIEQAENLDKESYAGLEDVFLDTKTIQGQEGKITLLIFGKNHCTYCDKLKDDIKNNTSLKSILQSHFLPYYINISYTKNHHLQFQNAPESTLSTSTLIFLTPTGEVIYELPGYLPSKELSALLKYMQSQKWKGKDKDTISLEINESLRNAFIDL